MAKKKYNILINKCLLSENTKIPDNKNIILFEGQIAEDQRLSFHIDNSIKNIVFGSIQNMHKALRLKSQLCVNKNDLICYYHDLKVSDYLPFLLFHYLNFCNSYFKYPSQLNSDDFGKFIKSDSGEKVLTGQVFDDTLFQQIFQKQAGVIDSDLLFLAPRKNVLREFRFWVLDDKIITASEYSWEKEKEPLKEIPPRIYDYVKSILGTYTPAIGFTLDVGVVGSRDVPDMKPNVIYDSFQVLEFNSYSSSGFYGADVGKIIDAVISYEELEFFDLD